MFILAWGGAGAGKVALDVGIICPQAAGHLADAAALGAAEEYVKTKCGGGDSERHSQEAVVVFQPMVFESLGGVSVEAERMIKYWTKLLHETQAPLRLCGGRGDIN